MPRPAPSRVAAALDYLERLKNQAAEFGGGVVENLADRARSAGELAYEALTSDPAIGRMTTAEFSEAADRPTPRLDQAARDIGTIGRVIVTQPIQTGRAIVQGEVERAREAMSSPKAAGEYAGSFIDPMRIAAALRKTAPILELDVYHGTPHRFEPTEANPLGEFNASKMGAGQGAQIHGQGIYLTENPKEAAQHRKIKGLQKNNEPADEFKVADAAAYAAKEKTGASLYHAELASHNILDWVRKGNKAEDFLRHNEVPESLRPVYEAALPYYAGYFKNEGSLYKADLPDEMIARMIDAEKPINQQSAEVRKALEEAGIDTKSSMLGSQISQKDLQKSGIAGLFYTNNRPGGPRNFVVFPGEEKKVRILERNGQPAPERIAQALEAAPSAFEQRLREQYGDFAQAYNLGLPDTPEYRRIVQEVTAQGPLSDDALREAIGAHPAYRQAGGKAAAAELRQSKRNGAAALVDSLSEQGIKTRVETSKSPGSRSTYIYASRGDKTVKIRLSDHLPAESGRVYGTNDIMTTPQHWKAATKRALKLLEETE